MMENGRVDGHRESRPIGSCHLTILNSVYLSQLKRLKRRHHFGATKTSPHLPALPVRSRERYVGLLGVRWLTLARSTEVKTESQRNHHNEFCLSTIPLCQ